MSSKEKKKNKKNKYEGVDIEELDVPMYRSYGKVRKIYPWFEKLKENILRGVLIFFLLFLAFIVVLIVYAMMVFSDILAFLITFIVGIVLLVILTRVPRKRIAFLRKLKRFCKKKGYALEFKRSFFASFIWDKGEGVDFVLKAGVRVYYVKLAAAYKRNSDMIFLSKNEMLYRKLRLQNRLTAAFNLQPKVTRMAINFPDVPEFEEAVRVILLNPVPRDIFIKDWDGATVVSGDGEDRFGYVIFGGSGFLGAVERNEKKDIW